MPDNKDEFTKEELLTLQYMKQLRLPAMSNAFEKQLSDPNANLLSFSERMFEIVGAEWDSHSDKKFQRNLKHAMLRYPAADIDETINDPARQLDADSIMRLNNCSWIDEGHNLLITGKSSSGKTYLCNALCISALRKFKTVVYYKASRLIDLMEKARQDRTYYQFVDKLLKMDLLVIDDFGLMPLDMDECRDMFGLIDARESAKKSTAVVSQLPVKNWFDLFKDPTYADAILTRLTDKRNTYRLEMNGRNMREPF